MRIVHVSAVPQRPMWRNFTEQFLLDFQRFGLERLDAILPQTDISLIKISPNPLFPISCCSNSSSFHYHSGNRPDISIGRALSFVVTAADAAGGVVDAGGVAETGGVAQLKARIESCFLYR